MSAATRPRKTRTRDGAGVAYELHGRVVTDKAADAVYADVMRRAAEAGLVVQAYGGVATLAVPMEQRKAGIREEVLLAAGLDEVAEWRAR